MIGNEAMSMVRACAALGGVLWGFAAIWALTVISGGFVRWEYASVYVALLVIILGLTTNIILFQRAATLRRTGLIGLIAVSLSLSALVVGNIIYMATS